LKNILLLILVSVAILSDASAQRKRTRTTPTTSRTRTQKSDASFANNLIYEIRFGNVGLGNPVSLSLKPGIGYKLNKTFSAGLNSKLFYSYFNSIGGSDYSEFDYGVNLYARGRISNSIFLTGEYGFTKYGTASNPLELYYPSVGGGYVSPGNGKWSYGAEVLLPLNGTARDAVGTIEYWIGFYYNLGSGE
jgi:hypothetical protein